MIDMPAMGATNWPPPSYDPQTELFYLNGTEGYGMATSTTPPTSPEGYGGGAAAGSTAGSALFALDIRTGQYQMEARTVQRGFGGGMSGGILTTAGHLLFTGDSGNLVAFDPANGKILWHQRLTQAVSNGPSTWMLDGKQYLIVGAGDCLYAFKIAGK